jgi:phosphoglycolate phosphatase
LNSGTCPPKSIRAVIFDFDGTLAELNIDFARMRRSVLKLIDQEGVLSEDLASRYVLEMIEAAAERLAATSSERQSIFRERAFEIIRGIEMEAASRGRLLSGTLPLLEGIRRGGCKSAVVTRNCRSAVLRVFPQIDVYCDLLLTRDDVPRVKPAADHLIRSMLTLETAPRNSAVVGDHPMDMRMGKDAGTWAVGVLSGHSTEQELRRAGADLVLATVADLIPLFS